MQRTGSMNKIKRVVIVGGTHGNELIGIYLVKKFERSPHLIQRSSFESCTLFANPRAYQLMKRYVDTDLNRCFRQQDLENFSLFGYEAQRAKVIYHRFGLGGEHPADLTIDLHTTTSNMGLTVILANKHPFNLQLASYLVATNPEVRVLCSSIDSPDQPYLDSMSLFGCTIEVGAVAQGVLDAVLFQKTEELVHTILNYTEAYNLQRLPTIEPTLSLYQSIGTIDYPRNQAGEIEAMIHPCLQFKDYAPLHPGEPMFLSFEGQEIGYEGKITVHPVFINEAAYYEKGVAMNLTQVLELAFEPVYA